MTRHIEKATFSAAVALALVFGARTAVAAPAPAETAALTCRKAYDCVDYCQTYDPYSSPRCYGGMCDCVYI